MNKKHISSRKINKKMKFKKNILGSGLGAGVISIHNRLINGFKGYHSAKIWIDMQEGRHDS